MADEKIKLIIETILADKDFKKGVSKMQKGLKSAGGSAGKLKKILGTVAKAFVAIGAAAVAGIAAFAKASVDAASNFEEANSKFETVFRGVVDKADKMREGLVDAYGLSTTEATRFLSSVQDLFVPLGFARDAAADMSNEVVKLATDLGSFNNLPTENVMLDIQSALVGNFETMKKYGVVLNETVIKAEALNRGMTLVKGQVSAQDKALIALTKIQEGSADAQGDAIRTAGSYANVIKRLKAQFEILKVEIGTGLIPALAEYGQKIIASIKKLNNFVKALREGSKEGQETVRANIKNGKAVTELGAKIQKAAKIVNFYKKELKKARAETSKPDILAPKVDRLKIKIRDLTLELSKWVAKNDLGFRNGADVVKSYNTVINESIEAQKKAAAEAKARAETAAAAEKARLAALLEGEKLTADQIKEIKRGVRDAAKEQRTGDVEDDIEHKEMLLDNLKAHQEQVYEKESEAAEAIRVLQDELDELYLERHEQRIERLKLFLDVATDVAASLTSIEENRLKKQEKDAAENFDKNTELGRKFRAQEEKEEKARFDAMDKAEQEAFLLKKEYEEGKAQAVADSTKETKNKLRRLAIFQRRAAIAEAVADAAAAVVKTMRSVPYPFNLPLAIAQGVAGAAQVSKIKSTPLPQYQEGVESLDRDRVAMVHKGERIVPSGINLAGISNEALIASAIRGLEMPSVNRQAPQTFQDNRQTSETTNHNVFDVPAGNFTIEDMLEFADRTNSPILRR